MTKKKVLIAEDNDLNLKLYLITLRSMDADILVAKDGDDALVQIQREHPDLVILDIQLPGKSGIEVAKEVRCNPAVRDVPILAITAYTMTGDREKILGAGCDYYLSKPIDTRVLPKIVQDLLAGRRPSML